MNGITNPIVFYPGAIVMIVFALLVIKFKNIFYSLLSAIVVFFLAGMYFYVLGSEYNAVVQIAVYGLAVPLILGLAIMFTNLKPNNEVKKESNLKYIMFFIGCLFILSLIYLVMTSYVIVPDGFNTVDFRGMTSENTFSAFGKGIFVTYVWAFELMSLVLTIAAIGLTMFKKENLKK